MLRPVLLFGLNPSSSADEVELVHRLRCALVQVAVHQFSGDPIEATGTADDVQSRVVWPNAATDLNIPEATDLTIEVIGPPTPQSFVWPDLAQTAVTTGPVVAMVWVEQLSLEPERRLAWQLMEARLFKDPEVVIERGRGWGREQGDAERRDHAGHYQLTHEVSPCELWAIRFPLPSRPYPAALGASTRPDVLLRYRLLPQPGGFEGLFPRRKPLDPRDPSLAEAVDPNHRPVHLNTAHPTTRLVLGDDQDSADRQLSRLLDVKRGVAIEGAEPVAEPPTDGLSTR